MVRVSILGASGYTGGEALRLLLDHPHVEVAKATSERMAGKFVHAAHPNLRGRTKLQFTSAEFLEPCDVLFVCLPHGRAAGRIEHLAGLAERIIDLSADFRLRDPGRYRAWMGAEHAAPAWLDRFVYGLPELHREELRTAKYVSGVGCNATATILALAPLAKAGLLERAVVEVKVGSSEAGAEPGPGGHHPERSGAVRSFAATGHRHQGEILQALGDFELHFSATAVEMVRGVLCTAHAFLREDIDDRGLWSVYRDVYTNEPFVRIVKDRTGLYRLPEPKILAGTNYCDVGFERDERTGRVVCLGAIDNLMKGAAGSAVQSMNVMLGFEETAGLGFAGLHPV
ncbi:MAG: N-acetyl-gamma-glutamyl-phosphate reductase [Phycisphaeraceae bacterium]|nr:MAG: N-acetyl-gamma-glutamyl-phosphate reductase [Phycisphaeraceae bacterium]